MEQSDLLVYAVSVLERLGMPYMVVGSVASSAYGEPRFTRDIDVVVAIRPEQVEDFCAAFPPESFYVDAVTVQQEIARGGQFNIIHPDSGNKIDVMVARCDPWSAEQLSRRQRVTLVTGVPAYTARPEDVILGKLQYYQEGGSEKHLRDIAGILRVSGDQVDRAYVARWAARLGVDEIWRELVERLGPGASG